MGRIYCLERIVTLVFDHLGFEGALPRLVSGCSGDNVLKSVCGSGLNTTEVNARDALTYYESDLRRAAGGLLVPLPPLAPDAGGAPV